MAEIEELLGLFRETGTAVLDQSQGPLDPGSYYQQGPALDVSQEGAGNSC